jgi:hypothetical protein
LLSPELVVSHGVEICDASRRNRNFAVIAAEGPSYLLKQGIGPQREATIAHEASVYQCLQSREDGREIWPFTPTFYSYDPEEHILVLEFLRNTEDLRRRHLRSGRFSIHAAQSLGNALSRLHRLVCPLEVTELEGNVTAEAPWILSAHCPDLSSIVDFSGASLELLRILSRYHEFGIAMDELRHGWADRSLIHHDMKWENCLVSLDGFGSRPIRPAIIDWELAGPGDPLWDVGAVFSEYLSCWVLSMPLTPGTAPERLPELAQLPLGNMQPAMRGFWETYYRSMEPGKPWKNDLVRAANYAGARLVQTAIEQAQSLASLAGSSVYLLQLSLNILRRPMEAAVQLLGIPLEEPA